MPDQEKKPLSEQLVQEGEREVSQAEGGRKLGETETKVTRNPDQAEGDRETVEEDLRNKGK